MWEKLLGMTPKGRERWEQTRQLGRARFVWLRCALSWGSCMFLFMTTYLLLSKADFVWQDIAFNTGLVVTGAILWPLGGYFVGALVWEYAEACRRRNL